MGEISLEMVWKRLEEMQADIRGVRVELATLNETVTSLARTQVALQRDVRSLKDRVSYATLTEPPGRGTPTRC
jgi:hypothetical protein